MSYALSPVFRQRFFDANGLPLTGGNLYTYVAGTTTPQDTFTNSAGTVNANPVVLDANGYADVWIDPTVSYKFVLEDSLGNLLWTVDNVSSPFEVAAWSAGVTYSQGEIVQDLSGFGLLYVSLTNNNVGNQLTDVAAWSMFDGNYRSTSSSAPCLVTDNVVGSNSTAGNLTQTLPPIASTPIGKKITVKDIGTAGNTTTVQAHSGDKFSAADCEGTAAQVYPKNLAQGNSITAFNSGSFWIICATGTSTLTTLTVQKFTSGSGTYTTPSNPSPLYIKVTMVGGGGGGSGGGALVATAGVAGGNTTFGTSLLTANGGGVSASTPYVMGGPGGTASLGSGPIGLPLAGGGGGAGGSFSTGDTGGIVEPAGGMGGANALGGAGASGYSTNNGSNGAANTGAGGGGGGANTVGAVTVASSGGGGGAGGYISAIINSPGSSYAYSVGAGGAGGAGATSTGGAGGSGLINVEEYYPI